MGHWRAVMDVPATAQGPSAARRLVATILPMWGMQRFLDDTELVVSELVTNAYRHAPGTDSFELELVGYTDWVRISLADGSSIKPIVAELDESSPSGRGMRIVGALATRWGADDHGGGKRVWVELGP